MSKVREAGIYIARMLGAAGALPSQESASAHALKRIDDDGFWECRCGWMSIPVGELEGLGARELARIHEHSALQMGMHVLSHEMHAFLTTLHQEAASFGADALQGREAASSLVRRRLDHADLCMDAFRRALAVLFACPCEACDRIRVAMIQDAEGMRVHFGATEVTRG